MRLSIILIISHLIKSEDYWVDVSFPIFSRNVSTNYDYLPHNIDPVNFPTPPRYKNIPIQRLGNRQEFYNEFMEGCRNHYGPKKAHTCDAVEEDRIAMSIRQPQSMQNYTTLGFKKIPAPRDLMDLLNNHWSKNKDNQKMEKWFDGNTYTNHWAAPTYMVSVEDQSLRGGAGPKLKQKIWDATRETIEEWTGMEQRATSLYGIRVYTEGAVLSPHVDRLPLVSSAIVNVAQDVEEDWPLEVYGHDGKVYNVTMKPGDMVLYESHSLIHGRPFQLKGKYYANIFIHFEPTGRPLQSELKDDSSRLPPYIRRNTPESKRWLRTHEEIWEAPAAAAVPLMAAHQAAATGNMKALKEIAEKDSSELLTKDKNGWEPLHEAARGGHFNVLQVLVEEFGANVNELTTSGGHSPLSLAVESLGEDHPAVHYLLSVGAEYGESEL